LLWPNDAQILCLTKLEYNPEIISMGTANGVVKDFDIASRSVVRRVPAHESPVVQLSSKENLLLSGAKNGHLVLFDYSSGKEVSELELQEEGFDKQETLT